MKIQEIIKIEKDAFKKAEKIFDKANFKEKMLVIKQVATILKIEALKHRQEKEELLNALKVASQYIPKHEEIIHKNYSENTNDIRTERIQVERAISKYER